MKRRVLVFVVIICLMSSALVGAQTFVPPEDLISGQRIPIVQLVTPMPTETSKAQLSAVLSDDRILPDSIFYGVDLFIESVLEKIRFNPVTRSKRKLLHASERVNEIAILTQKFSLASTTDQGKILRGIEKAQDRHVDLLSDIGSEDFSSLDITDKIEGKIVLIEGLEIHSNQIRNLEFVVNNSDLTGQISIDSALQTISVMKSNTDNLRINLEASQNGGVDIIEDIKLQIDGKVSDKKFDELVVLVNAWPEASILISNVTDSGGVIMLLRVIDINNVVVHERVFSFIDGKMVQGDVSCGDNCRIFEVNLNQADLRPLIRGIEETDRDAVRKIGQRFKAGEIIKNLKENLI